MSRLGVILAWLNPLPIEVLVTLRPAQKAHHEMKLVEPVAAA